MLESIMMITAYKPELLVDSQTIFKSIVSIWATIMDAAKLFLLSIFDDKESEKLTST